METTGNKSAFVELICQLRDFGLSTAANAIRDLERDNVMVASNNHKLRTELAATQLAMQEAREALRKARTRIVEHGGSGWKCSVTQIDLILSRPADTTALNRYVAGATETAWAQASRLAMELECLLLSSKDTAAVSKWWDSAHEALDEYRRVFADELEGK